MNHEQTDQLPPTISILNVPLSVCDRSTLLVTISRFVESKHKSLILSGNVHAFNLAYQHDWLRTIFNRADIVRIDGAGVRLGARILGYKIPSRMTWADFAWDLAAVCAENHYTLYFLGGRPGVAEKAAAKLHAQYPVLQFVGIQHGYFDMRQGSLENTIVIQQINQVQPDILVVGFGMPLQEHWLAENWSDTNAIVTLTGGAVFDYISGELTRPPKWMTDWGLEWLGRMIVEPRRLWQRYLIGNPLFLVRVLRQRLGLIRFDQ